MPEPVSSDSRRSARSRAQRLVDRVERYIMSHHLFPPDGSVVVGVSGGPDSLALLHILLSLKLRRFPDLRLHVAHLDHGLRGAAAAADAAAVAELAASWSLPATMERRDVERHRAAHRLSVEQAAREVRYRFFAEVAGQTGARWIATGHTADDAVETVLLHLLRGAGTLGLRGMLPASPLPFGPPDTPLTLVRPLLEVSRAETEAYCQDQALPARQDPTNRSPAFLRNRVRHELLPMLEQYNPRVREALLRLARQAAEDQEVLEEEVARVWPGLARVTPGRVALNLGATGRLPRALQKYVLRRALTELLGDLQGIALVHVEAMVAALSRPVGTEVSLPRGARFVRDYREAVLSLTPTQHCGHPPLDGAYPVPMCGTPAVPGWTVRTRLEGLQEPPDAPPKNPDPWIARLDADTVKGALHLRPRRPGDRFQPLGMEGTKKLQDFFVDVRVPRACRDHVPLLVAGDDILWVVGWRVDHRACVTPTTRRVLVVECRPQESPGTPEAREYRAQN